MIGTNTGTPTGKGQGVMNWEIGIDTHSMDSTYKVDNS